MNTDKTSFQFVCYGEILWDVLPDKKLPGGAPMNVAYHLQKMQKKTALISKMGNDDLGRELISVLKQKNIDTSFCVIDNKYITGVVNAIAKEDNEMTYEILHPVAWDFNEWSEAIEELTTHAEYFVFGSLITRNEQSRNTLFKLLEKAKTKVLDINLRPPHFNREIIEQLLLKTDILKLNFSELKLVTDWFHKYDNEKNAIKFLKQRFNISTVIVTKGEEGAVLDTNDKFYSHSGYNVNVADTIGSGDSFLAGFLSKIADNSSPEKALEFACALGALVASRTGGCPEYSIAEVGDLINKIIVF
ncbi:MAG: carbohydrate kinase family protein [Chitinophagaceae bacterium]